MQIFELLQTRKEEILKQLETLQTELQQIERMQSAAAVPELPGRGARPKTKDDAIVDAIRAGNHTPKSISEYIREHVGGDVNDASTRTRLSRMKADGKLTLDAKGWQIVG